MRFLSLLFIMLFTAGCSKTQDENLPTDTVEIELTSDQVSLIGSGNEFAFDLFRLILGNADPSENIIISPLSISYALSMTLNGANGSTREAMLEALRVNCITPDEINEAYKKLTEALLSVDKRVLISIANSVWTEENFIVKKSFIDILTKYYDAESRGFDIDDPDAPDKINKWIEDKTNGLIRDMIDELSDNAVMLLINAIYFKGKWKSEFDPDVTADRSFFKNGNIQVSVPMMNQTTDIKITKENSYTMAELPYGQGNYVIDIILPDNNDGLNSITSELDEIIFNNAARRFSVKEADIFLPKFKYGYKIELKDILTDLGMGIAFTDQADFTNIADNPPLLINKVTHQAFIETNEEGTEAAAATVVEIGFTSAGPARMVFNADHPFIYIIRETSTNSVIFMGRVSDPLAN